MERRSDWRDGAEQYAGRQYSIGLGARGRNALQKFGLWEACRARGVASDAFILHVSDKRAFNIRQNAGDTEPSCLINRGALCAALLEALLERYGASGRLEVRFGVALDEVDVEASVVRLGGKEERYDLLVGADGVRSRVRAAVVAVGGAACEMRELPGGLKVVHSPMPAGLQADAVHAFGGRSPPGAKGDAAKAEGKFGIFSIPAPGGRACTLLSWEDDSAPADLLSAESPAELSRLVAERFPTFGPLSDEAAAAVLAQEPTRAAVVQCDQYSFTGSETGSAVVLLGDAAHSTGGTLGQGANSALQDVVALDRALTAHSAGSGALTEAARAYSARQAPEGAALLELLELRPAGPISGVAFGLDAAYRAIGPKINSEITPGVQAQLTQTLRPYTQIVAQNEWLLKLIRWEAKGKKGGDRGGEKPAGVV